MVIRSCRPRGGAKIAADHALFWAKESGGCSSAFKKFAWERSKAQATRRLFECAEHEARFGRRICCRRGCWSVEGFVMLEVGVLEEQTKRTWLSGIGKPPYKRGTFLPSYSTSPPTGAKMTPLPL